MTHFLKRLTCLCLAAALTAGGFALSEEAPAEKAGTIVYGCDEPGDSLSPFFPETDEGARIAYLTQIRALTLDREGAVVQRAVEGETRAFHGVDYTYTGPCDVFFKYDEDADETTYTLRLREGLTFSDGVPVTADDLIFTYYVLLDPAAAPVSPLADCGIAGADAYRTGTTDAFYAEYAAKASAIRAAGPAHTANESDPFTAVEQAVYQALRREAWLKEVRAIVDYCAETLGQNAEAYLGLSPEQVEGSESLQVALAMCAWGYGGVEDGVLTDASGKAWALGGEELPALTDFYELLYAACAGDAAAFQRDEALDPSVRGVDETATDDFVRAFAARQGAQAVSNVRGIGRADDLTVTVRVKGYVSSDIYTACDVPVAPHHYYGDADAYDYAENRFGHPYGDLSGVYALNASPLGAGPYRLAGRAQGEVRLAANDRYYAGEPATGQIIFRTTATGERPAALETGLIDLCELPGGKAYFAAIRSLNQNGELSGGSVVSSLIPNAGYGYVGLNASTVRVGDDAGSDASKNLRKGLCTLLAAFRDQAIDAYYGDAAYVLEYPVSASSWAAPRSDGEGYRAAYSLDPEGNAIYAPDMTDKQRRAAAIEACKAYLTRAGYVWSARKDAFTEAPEGASLTYRMALPGSGTANHPAYALYTRAAKALASIGIALELYDPADPADMWRAVRNGQIEIWCAAWTCEADPDMYAIYHSDSLPAQNGAGRNYYHIADEALDAAIEAERTTSEAELRRAPCLEAYDLVLGWGVELPFYQRYNLLIARADAVDASSLPADQTAWYDWTRAAATLRASHA